MSQKGEPRAIGALKTSSLFLSNKLNPIQASDRPRSRGKSTSPTLEDPAEGGSKGGRTIATAPGMAGRTHGASWAAGEKSQAPCPNSRVLGGGQTLVRPPGIRQVPSGVLFESEESNGSEPRRECTSAGQPGANEPSCDQPRRDALERDNFPAVPLAHGRDAAAGEVRKSATTNETIQNEPRREGMSPGQAGHNEPSYDLGGPHPPERVHNSDDKLVGKPPAHERDAAAQVRKSATTNEYIASGTNPVGRVCPRVKPVTTSRRTSAEDLMLSNARTISRTSTRTANVMKVPSNTRARRTWR